MSYSKDLKNILAEATVKKRCCKRNYDFGFSLPDGILAPVPEIKCDSCVNMILRGAFVKCGSVTDPAKRYHLEFSLQSEEIAKVISGYISDIGFVSKSYMRKGKHIVYMKSSDAISEFLAAIGANSAAFDIINNRIMGGMTSDITRAVNFDTANIRRSADAFERDIEAIRYLEEQNELDKLPPHLLETARLRLEYDHIPLAELGSRHSNSISKSGVKHRLDAVVAIYREKIAKNSDK